VAGIENFLPAIGGEQGAALSLDRVAPALNAIDRAVPGLGAALAPQAADRGGPARPARDSRWRSKASAASTVPVALHRTAPPRSGRFRWASAAAF
jgi:hypothetical protein